MPGRGDVSCDPAVAFDPRLWWVVKVTKERTSHKVNCLQAGWADLSNFVLQVLLVTILIFAALTVFAHAQQLPRMSHGAAESDQTGLKWVILAFAFAGVFPLAVWIRRYPSIAPPIWMLMGMLPFAQTAIPHTNFALISWADWPGFVKGAEFSGLDLVALAVYFSLPRARSPVPFRMAMLVYFAAVLLSSLQAEEPIAALFYAWQLARIFLVYAVVSKACVSERFVPSLLAGMSVALCFEACIVIWQRFALNVIQPTGALGHQNGLGLMSEFVVFPNLALLLARYPRLLLARYPRGLALVTFFSGALTAALTASRATIGLAGLGYIALFSLSIQRRGTQWKALMGFIGVVGMVLLAVLALSSLERRFAISAGSSYDERAAFESAAATILADHPMGIGANNYAFFATTEGYSRNARVASLDPALSPHVHSIYWLTAAETGYLGLVALVLLLLRPLTVAFICAWRNRGDRRSELLLGLGTSLLIVYIHSAFEWATLNVEIQYVLAMVVGMVAGVAQKLGYWQHAGIRRRRSVSFGVLRRRRNLRHSEKFRSPDSVLSRETH
jgi:hypothetical protein